jgi:transposase
MLFQKMRRPHYVHISVLITITESIHLLVNYTSQQQKRYNDIFLNIFLCLNQNNWLLSFTLMFAWNAFILIEQTITSCSVTEKFRKVNFLSHDRVCHDRIWAFKSPSINNCAVNKSKQFAILKIRIFTRMSIPRLRQNDRERAVGMVQAGMTHQAVSDHINVSRITISRLMIPLRQTGRKNARSRDGRSRVTSQCQNIHLRLIHLRNRMITAENTWSSKCHRTARLAWARACRRWRLHTWQHIFISFESRFSLRHSDWRYRVYRSRGERFTDQCLYESDCFGGGSVMVWAGIWHDGRTQLKIVQGTLNAVKYRDDILDPIVLPFLQQRNINHVFNMTMQDVTWFVFVKTLWTRESHRVLPWPTLYHQISHQLNIYGRNSVDVFATVKIHRKHYRSCLTHLCTSGTTSYKPLSNDWLVLGVGDAKLSCLQKVVTHAT